MDVDANDQWMDSDSLIRTVLTLFGLCNPDYGVGNDVSNPGSVKTVRIM